MQKVFGTTLAKECNTSFDVSGQYDAAKQVWVANDTALAWSITTKQSNNNNVNQSGGGSRSVTVNQSNFSVNGQNRTDNSRD
jgi:hypothetical protein